MLEKEGTLLMIEALTSVSNRWAVGELEYPFGRGINFQIEISDVVGLLNTFKTNSYPIFLEMEDKWYRKNNIEVGNRQFLVQDPDGYLFRFFQDLGKRSR